MKRSRHFVTVAVAAITAIVGPCFAQEPHSSQVTPSLSGTGAAGKIAVWKNSTTLGGSVISQSSGSVGIGTTTPAAKLEVNGNAQVDGSFSLSGDLLWGGTTLLQVPGGMTNGNTALGLGALPPNTAGTGMTAVGTGALAAGTGGFHNTAVGNAALG